MRTIRIAFALLSFIFTTSVIAQAPVKLWDKTYGGTEVDNMNVILPLSDGNYLLGGSSYSPISGDKSEAPRDASWGDYWVIKVDPSGTKIWDKRFGGTGGDYIMAMTPTTDGGFLLVGMSWSPASGDKTQGSRGGNDIWVVKIDATGNKQWDKTYGGDDDDEGHCVIPTADGNFLIGGSSESGITGERSVTNFGTRDYWIIKIDPSGNKIWDKAFGGHIEDELYEIIAVSDGYLLAGSSGSLPSGNKTSPRIGGRDYWLVKTDLSGNKQWEQVYGGTDQDYLTSFITTPDGGYMLAGTSLSPISGDKTEALRGLEDYWIVKIDAAGVKQWDRSFGGSNVDELQSAKTVDGGGYLFGGSSRSGITGDKTQTNRGWEDFWLVRTDATGNKIWDLTIGGTNEDELYDMEATPDGGWLLGGHTWSGVGGDKTAPSKGSIDFWSVRLGLPASVTVNAPGSTSFCAGESFTIGYTATGTFNAGNVFTAQLSDQFGSFGGPINMGTVTSTTSGNISVTIPSGVFQGSNYRIRVVASNPAVTGADNGTNLTINRPGTMQSVANMTFCNGIATTPVSFQSSVVGTQYSWTNSNTSIGLPASGNGNLPSFTATNTSSTAQNATITVTPSYNGCDGTPETFTIKVNPTPVLTAVANQSLCNAAATTAVSFASNLSGTQYNWTNNNSGIGIGATGTGNIPSFNVVNNGTSPVTATITVTPTADGCAGTPGTFSITVKPTPTVNAVSNATACNGASVAAINFTGAVNNTTFNWTNNNTATGLAASGAGNIASFNAVNTGNAAITSAVSVSPAADGCFGTPATFSITVNPSTKITTQPASIAVCATTPASFTVAGTGTGTLTYQWKKNGTNITNATSATYTIPSTSATDAGNYTVDVSSDCGTVTSNAATLTVNTTPGCITSLPQIDADVTASLLMPNVATSKTVLRMQAKKAMKVNWIVVDASGRQVRSFTQQLHAGQLNDKQVDVGGLSQGVYQFVGTTANGVVVLKFVKL